MSTINRRTMLKGTAAAAAGLTVASKASKPLPPAVIQSGPTKIVYWGSFADQLRRGRKTASPTTSMPRSPAFSSNISTRAPMRKRHKKLTAAVAAKQTPDVSLLSDVWWFKFYLNHMLAPLNDLIASNNVDTTDYVDSLYSEGVRDGESMDPDGALDAAVLLQQGTFTPAWVCRMDRRSGTI